MSRETLMHIYRTSRRYIIEDHNVCSVCLF
jgi:hypothetical protein